MTALADLLIGDYTYCYTLVSLGQGVEILL